LRGIEQRGGRTETIDEVGDDSLGVIGDLITVACGVEIIGKRFQILCYDKLLVLPRDFESFEEVQT